MDTVVQSILPESVQKAIAEIRDTWFEQVLSSGSGLIKGGDHKPTPMPSAFFVDPYAQTDSQGQGYTERPSPVTFETCRMMTERSTLLGAIIQTRLHQVESQLVEQANKYSAGYALQLIGHDPHRRLTNGEKDRLAKVKGFIRHDLGATYDPDEDERDDLTAFAKKFLRDRLSLDQACFQKVWSYGGLHSIYAMDSATIRHATPVSDRGWQADEGGANIVRYAQLVNGEIVGEFTRKELAFCIANPRSNIRVGGYGYPEPEMLITTVTSHLWAEEWNRRSFSQGSTTKGVLNMQGNVPPVQLEAFKRMWIAQTSGVNNAWRTPVLNAEGGIQWIPTQMNNLEMGYSQWMEYLIKIASAIYLIDPAEINFDLRGGMNSQPAFMTGNEAQQKLSRDRGLAPLLRFFTTAFNRHVIWNIDPEFEMKIVGLDAISEAASLDLRQKQVSTTLTLNEARALDDLPPVEKGDVVANPAWLGYLQSQAQNAMQEKQQAAMQAQQGGAPPGAPPGSQPVGGGFSGGAPGAEEADAAKKLNAHAKSKSDESSNETGPKDLTVLHRDDWASTVHSSLPQEDLAKSYVILDEDY